LVREYLNLKPGDRFKFFFQPDGTVVILPKIPASRLKGSAPRLNRQNPGFLSLATVLEIS
jgi:bifunctional DNA-binding transcriptional regulator/antitoxin component of YhaV-PrlF toxin-antitoxin module